jgi:cytochrome c
LRTLPEAQRVSRLANNCAGTPETPERFDQGERHDRMGPPPMHNLAMHNPYALGTALLVALSASVIPSLARAQEAGELLFNNSCRTCHTLNEGDNRLGPNLHNIVGRKAGSLPNYPYSAGIQGSGIVWDEETLDRFIENPDGVVPGNKMKPYAGMASAEDRATIVAYLKGR